MNNAITMQAMAIVKRGGKVYRIYAHDCEDYTYVDNIFKTREAAEDYIKSHLEPNDREAGIYEPNYYQVLDDTSIFE